MKIYEAIETMMNDNSVKFCTKTDNVLLVIQVEDGELVINKELSENVYVTDENYLLTLNAHYLNAEWEIYCNFNEGELVKINKEVVTEEYLIRSKLSANQILAILRNIEEVFQIRKVTTNHHTNYKYMLNKLSSTVLFSDDELIRV